MPIADSIRKLGFRRWHERQLIEAHASLVTAFLGVILIAVCLDQMQWRDGGIKPFIMLALAAGGVMLCFKTVGFYFAVLFRAEHFAAQAKCDHCGVYGVINILAAPARAASLDDAASTDWLKVRCKKCGHDWTINGMPP